MKKFVKIIDIPSNDTIFECHLDEIQEAYKKFSEYEELGLEVKLVVPTTAETLYHELGSSNKDLSLLREALEDEIDSHNDDSCCRKYH